MINEQERLWRSERERLWRSLLDSDLNHRYWYIQARRYYLSSRLIKMLTVLFASLTFVGLSIGVFPKHILLLLAGSAAILTVMDVFFRFDQLQTRARTLAKGWTGLNHSYRKLWSITTEDDFGRLRKELEALRRIEIEITSSTDFLPRRDPKLIQKLYEEIVDGLEKESPSSNINADARKEI